MLSAVEATKAKWQGTHIAVDNWLNERQALLVTYCQLAGLPPFEHGESLPNQQDISGFCEQLMDYVSKGHFEVYELLAATTSDEASQQALDDMLPALKASTDLALSFNDTYADDIDASNLQAFDVSLSALGQSLEERFILEDKLIEQLSKEVLSS